MATISMDWTHLPKTQIEIAQHERYGFCLSCRSEMWRLLPVHSIGNQFVEYLRPIDFVEMRRAEPARQYHDLLTNCSFFFTEEDEKHWDVDFFHWPHLLVDERCSESPICGHPPQSHTAAGCQETVWVEDEYHQRLCPCPGYTKPGYLMVLSLENREGV